MQTKTDMLLMKLFIVIVYFAAVAQSLQSLRPLTSDLLRLVDLAGNWKDERKRIEDREEGKHYNAEIGFDREPSGVQQSNNSYK